MPVKILMPALSPTMTDGTLAKWLKKEGDKVAAGDVIAEIETDKATMEVEAVDEGKLVKVLVKEGTTEVKVNSVIAVLLEDGESEAELAAFIKEIEASNAGRAQQKEELGSGEAPKPEPAPEAKAPEPKAAPRVAAPAQAAPISGRVFASPLARRLAREAGINLASVSGSGPRGRIIKHDIENYAPAASGIVRRNPVEFEAIPNNTMRRVIAERLLESKQNVPHFYLSIECQMDALLSARADINKSKTEKRDKISVNDFIIMATSKALKDVPEANSSWQQEAIKRYNNIDISVAVAIDGGLITPIIRNADQKTLPQLSSEMKDLASRARENKLSLEEFQGGNFSISNLGMYGIKNFSAIINPPQSCILAVGASSKRPMISASGAVEVATIMDVTLSSDHRVVDGAVGANFLDAFKKYVESPVTMFVN